MIDITGFGHINIIVDSIENATKFYQDLFGAIPIQYFPNFKNIGFAKAAGFLDQPGDVNISINFIKIPQANIYLELICYHSPQGKTKKSHHLPNDFGGPRHIALCVKNINSAFEKIRQMPEITLINSSPEYKPCKLDEVYADQFVFHDNNLEKNHEAKKQSAQVSSTVSFFYFTDKYGVMWELEETLATIDDPALAL
jgi:methylmalonyl-CoA/ethylmalonyl-CoA epimerase